MCGRNRMKDSIKLLIPLGRSRKIADPLFCFLKISCDPPVLPPHHHQKFVGLRMMSNRGHDIQRSLRLPAEGLGERCKVQGQSPGGGAHRCSENPGVSNNKIGLRS